MNISHEVIDGIKQEERNEVQKVVHNTVLGYKNKIKKIFIEYSFNENLYVIKLSVTTSDDVLLCTNGYGTSVSYAAASAADDVFDAFFYNKPTTKVDTKVDIVEQNTKKNTKKNVNKKASSTSNKTKSSSSNSSDYNSTHYHNTYDYGDSSSSSSSSSSCGSSSSSSSSSSCDF